MVPYEKDVLSDCWLWNRRAQVEMGSLWTKQGSAFFLESPKRNAMLPKHDFITTGSILDSWPQQCKMVSLCSFKIPSFQIFMASIVPSTVCYSSKSVWLVWVSKTEQKLSITEFVWASSWTSVIIYILTSKMGRIVIPFKDIK